MKPYDESKLKLDNDEKRRDSGTTDYGSVVESSRRTKYGPLAGSFDL